MFEYLLLFAAGLASHVLYFNRGEHHMQAPTYLVTAFLTYWSAVAALVKFNRSATLSALLHTTACSLSYLAGLYGSLIVYRLYFHPLRKFPGPWQARITSLWQPTRLKAFNGYLVFDQWHRQFGKFVRVGSNDLSISHADINNLTFAPNTLFRKGDWYDASVPYTSMHTTRDRPTHDRRRRIWAPAFSDKALREYEVSVRAFNDKFVEKLREHRGGPINASWWFNLYAFDVMGRLAFGKDYGMLESGERHWALDMVVKGMSAVPPRTPVWLIRMAMNIPGALKDVFVFLDFSKRQLEWRVAQDEQQGDITGWLLKAYKDWKKPTDDPMFTADSRLIIIAGSETTAATLSHLFYELATHPEELHKLREELQEVTAGKKDWTDVDLKHAAQLNGAIYEALRLHPPLPSGIKRTVPKGGATVGDVFLPGETSFWMPTYVIGRDEDNFDNALEFVPERWYSKPEMIKHKNAFSAFSLGAENCIGKNLALMEIRTLATQLLLNFDVALAPNEDGHKLLYQSKDHVSYHAFPIMLCTPYASSSPSAEERAIVLKFPTRLHAYITPAKPLGEIVHGHGGRLGDGLYSEDGDMNSAMPGVPLGGRC